MPRDRLLTAIREVYDSATDAARWPGCLTSIGRLLGGTSTNLLYTDHRSTGGIQLAVGADPELYRLYSDFGHAIDPWARSFRPGAVPAGEVVIGAYMLEHARMRKTEFYAAMGRRYDCTRCVVGVLHASTHRTAVLTVNRGDRHDEFDARDSRVMTILLPHLRRALAVQRRLGALDNERAPILDAIDRLALGVMLVDSRARPICVNRSATRMLEKGGALSIENESLVAAAPGVSARLARALGSAIAVAHGGAFATEHGELVVPRSAGRRPLFVSVSPVGQRQSYNGLARPAAAVVFLVDPDAIALAPHDRLQALYSLTAAEARVAGALAAGQSAADVSERFGVSRETARSQIKRVFEKAGVRSQSAFIRLAAVDTLHIAHARER